MTVLHCLCGERIEGSGAFLLEAVEAHLEASHHPRPRERHVSGQLRRESGASDGGTHHMPKHRPGTTPRRDG